jgi:hypothetical protein
MRRVFQLRKDEGVIGPVQLLVIGFRGSESPDQITQDLRRLRSGPVVRIIDALLVRVDRSRAVEQTPMPDLIDDSVEHPGRYLEALFRRASAANTLGESRSEGVGYLFRGDEIPQLEQTIPPGSGGLALLLEHRWAIPLRDSVVQATVRPLADAWIGREGLQELGLIPPDNG